MLELLTNPEAWIALVTLTALELGLFMAMFMRLALLHSARRNSAQQAANRRHTEPPQRLPSPRKLRMRANSSSQAAR